MRRARTDAAEGHHQADPGALPACLYHYRKPNGEPLTFRSQHARLMPIRGFFRWLARQKHLLYNPASELELPRLEKRLPKHVLTPREAETGDGGAGPGGPLGLRDRAILETLYSTGMRRQELIGLQVFRHRRERGTVMIRQGKGKKDRMIPIGERALAWIEQYLDERAAGAGRRARSGHLARSS